MRIAFAFAFCLGLGVGAATASADEGPRPSPSPRPPSVVLRHVDAPRRDVEPRSRPELVLLVGGFASSTDDHVFDDLTTRLRASGYDVRRFGDDPRFSYDTTGTVAQNGRSLRDEIRALSADYGAIHIVAHSMGGVVTDAALADGHGGDDGVATYIALASPHSGSSLAALAQIALSVAGDARPELVAAFGRTIDSAAARDLARVTPPPVRDDIVRIDLREATDWTVSGDDMRYPGILARTYASASLDGHDEIVHDATVAGLIERVIRERGVPLDDRSAALATAGALQDRLHDGWRSAGLGCLFVAACAAAFALRLHRLARTALEPLWRPLERRIGRAWA